MAEHRSTFAQRLLDRHQPRGAYATSTATLDGATFSSESGVRLTPDCAFDDLDHLDTLIIPGGAPLRGPGGGLAIAEAVRRRAPECRLDCDKIFIKDGGFYTSAGITAAIDLSLALIEEDFGPRLALTVARDLVVYVKRPGGQLQYSEPLRFQARAGDRFADLAAWIVPSPTEYRSRFSTH